MKKTNGFTLVELLVVISIIAVLLAVLMPSLGKAREQGRRIVCANNQKTMAMGDIMYAQASDDWHVPIVNGLSKESWRWCWNPLFVKIIGMKGRFNAEESQGFIAKTLPKEYKCPTDKRTVANGGLNGSKTIGSTIEGTSYGMNSVGLRSCPPPDGCGGWCDYDTGSAKRKAHTLKTTQVVRPADKFFIMDAEWVYVNYASANYLEFWDRLGDKMTDKEWDMPAYRHKEGANMVFYDGHMKYLSKKEIFKVHEDAIEQYQLNKTAWQPIPDRMYIDPPYHD